MWSTPIPTSSGGSGTVRVVAFGQTQGEQPQAQRPRIYKKTLDMKQAT